MTPRRVYLQVKGYGVSHRTLYAVSFMIFFWAIFDGMISYSAPLAITEAGFSGTMMGIILASSSVAGAVFDFFLSGVMHRRTTFRRVYLLMFGLAIAMPFLLIGAKNIFIFLAAMAIWGFYYDLVNFGDFDFIYKESKKDEYVSNFGILDIFKVLGYVIAPVLAGFLIGELINPAIIVYMFAFLFTAFSFYLLVLWMTRKRAYVKEDIHPHRKHSMRFLAEVKIWRKVGKSILPILGFMMLINIFDSFFWVVGPIFSEELQLIHPLGEFLIPAYLAPALIVGWFGGQISNKFGKSKTASTAFFLGSSLLAIVSFVASPVIIILVVFCASFLSSLAWPTVKGMFVDFINQKENYEGEIEGLADFATNLGYIVGPVTAGVLSDVFGSARSFAVLGAIGAVSSLLLFKLGKSQWGFDKS
ncbi:MAG: hypothetical protein UW21_C0018G0007 [Candidatus Woesebacteria bacterium GW2011_GWB1_44_11b]|uniref:Major facilitator superfamily (MFS) profile domain-containing protein n=1 Tax=Candidatus Woesebacteria bacterium GW2011_GWB1_44_11b TaxID=1618580 RepID=A0A0G1GD31_9BACT|nr:MAG: hypothetical protein UW21_C0018G0007 [Candidatus Woesebacteria bacterium GW2011_GWB1_44_11b]